VVGWLDCQLHKSVAAGDHTIFVGEVAAWAVCDGCDPLLYYGHNWRQLAEHALPLQT
jgi:flavin reductase (DIM6/NTAB) family NADH-FMN oxidoreductase RutF